MVAATARMEAAGYLSALILVYSALILAWVLLSWVQVAGPMPGVLVPIARFLDGTVGPAMRVARRFIPPLGPLDLSPIAVLLLVQIGGGLLVNLVRG